MIEAICIVGFYLVVITLSAIHDQLRDILKELRGRKDKDA